MNGGMSARVARFTAAGAAALLLVDLFLDWQMASIRVAGIVEVETTAAGWRGWGFVAGVLALALVAVLLTDEGRRVLAAALGLCTVVATTIAVVTGDADVSGGPAATVEDSTLWAAWLGLALAAVAFLATLVPLGAQAATQAAGAPHSAA